MKLLFTVTWWDLFYLVVKKLLKNEYSLETKLNKLTVNYNKKEENMQKTEPKTLSGFMELLPNEQVLFNQMKKFKKHMKGLVFYQ